MTTAARPFAGTKPPPIESLGKAYFTPLMSVPVTTRQPQTAPSKETVTEYLRIQSGGGAVQSEGILWDVALILHSYAPNDQEAQAEETLSDALGWGANAQGTYITLKSGATWWVTYSSAPSLTVKQQDPYVDLVRYKGTVMWRVHGNPLPV
jgi:hypothetical protein